MMKHFSVLMQLLGKLSLGLNTLPIVKMLFLTSFLKVDQQEQQQSSMILVVPLPLLLNNKEAQLLVQALRPITIPQHWILMRLSFLMVVVQEV